MVMGDTDREGGGQGPGWLVVTPLLWLRDTPHNAQWAYPGPGC